MGVFREKSLNKISSPEQLNDYMKVTGIHVWIILGAIIFLLIAICLWGVLYRIETRITVKGTSFEGDIKTRIAKKDIGDLEKGKQVIVNETTGKVTSIKDEGDFYTVVMDVPEIATNVNEFEIVTESIAPISFIFN